MLDLSSANDTRVHRPREMEGRQGIVQWEGRKKRRDRKRREDGRKPFDLSLVSPIVYLRFLIFAARISFHLGTNELLSSRYTEDTCNVKFAPQSIDIT